MRNRGILAAVSLAVCVSLVGRPVWAQNQAKDVTADEVLQAINLGKRFLADAQNGDGSWTVDVNGPSDFKTGITSLALLALLNSGMTIDEEPVKKGLAYLRTKVRAQEEPDWVYEIALMIMALEAANEGQRDLVRIQQLATRLENAQNTTGPQQGSWSYTASGRLRAHWDGDRSNAQYALLGLHAAAEAGVSIKRSTWERARKHWLDTQMADGGWNYTSDEGFRRQQATGSMTAAGIASLVICEAHLHDPGQDEVDGQPLCCRMPEDNEPLERALAWMGRHAQVGINPGNNERILYYAYGIERAGRLSARRFFGTQDWYRDWARFLVNKQNKIRNIGSWEGLGPYEKEPVIGTSFALLFLSKGLAPVLMQKLMYGEPDGVQAVKTDNWNRHPSDLRRLTEHISKLPKWPNLVTWQVLNLNQAVVNSRDRRNNKTGDPLAEVRQAPILYIGGDSGAYQFTQEEAALLRAYVDQGGFILGMVNCPQNGQAFEESFRALIAKMYPNGEATLQRLPKDHLVFRSEYAMNPEDFDLLGVEAGCRTAIMFSRDDLACLWNMIETPKPEGRSDKVAERIERDTRMGVNIIAYATGREPPNKLEADNVPMLAGEQDQIERGFLQIAKLKHSGNWDVAPRALKNLLMGLNQKVGAMATTKDKALQASDPDIYKYPLVYMHGRTAFQIPDKGVEQLREHLKRGGVLFADACCGARAFDLSFRDLAEKLFPDKELKRIPISHEIFSDKVFYDLSTVRRRMPQMLNPDEPLSLAEREVEPYLEGIEIDGRYVLIYSKYDISCALERQTSAGCAGYIPEDALRIAINVVMYSLLQNTSYIEELKTR